MRTARSRPRCPHHAVEEVSVPQKPKPLDDTASVRAWWGVELRNWRKQRGLSSAALGAEVHLSSTSVERIEKNERPCTAALARRFDVVLSAGGALVRLWARVEAEADNGRDDADNHSAAGQPTEVATPAPSASPRASPWRRGSALRQGAC
jgi:ribosome-binding protein aMBF1 (putative translation factor)